MDNLRSQLLELLESKGWWQYPGTLADSLHGVDRREVWRELDRMAKEGLIEAQAAGNNSHVYRRLGGMRNEVAHFWVELLRKMPTRLPVPKHGPVYREMERRGMCEIRAGKWYRTYLGDWAVDRANG